MRRRISQFARAGRRPTAAQHELARLWLAAPLLDLFLAQHPRDIVHGAECAAWLLERGHSEPDLVAAALIHDVGKGHQRRADRAIFVLAEAARVAPRLASAASRFEVRRALARALTHAATGADALAAAGAPPRVVALARGHHADAGGDAMLSALQQADAAT